MLRKTHPYKDQVQRLIPIIHRYSSIPGWRWKRWRLAAWGYILGGISTENVTSWRPLLSAEFAKDYGRQSVNLGTVIVQPYLRIKRLKAIVVDSVNFTSNQIVVSHVWLPPMWMMRHPCNPSCGGDDGRRLGLVGVGGRRALAEAGLA
jgi:hypothetical protein